MNKLKNIKFESKACVVSCVVGSFGHCSYRKVVFGKFDTRHFGCKAVTPANGRPRYCRLHRVSLMLKMNAEPRMVKPE